MLRLLQNLVRDESGQDLAEYAISMLIISAGIGSTIYALQFYIRTIWDNLSGALR